MMWSKSRAGSRVGLLGIAVVLGLGSACEKSNEPAATGSPVPSAMSAGSPAVAGITPSPGNTSTPVPSGSPGGVGALTATLSACGPGTAESPPQENTLWRQLVPHRILDEVAAISAGREFDAAGYGWKPGLSYAVTRNGEAWYWGLDSLRGSTDYPRKLTGLKNVRQLSGSFALTGEGQVWKVSPGEEPQKVSGGERVRTIQQMGEMDGALYALKSDGTVWRMAKGDSGLSRLDGYEHIREIYGSYFSLFLVDGEGGLIYLNGRYMSGKLTAEAVGAPAPVERMAVGYSDEALILTAGGQAYEFRPDGKPQMVRKEQADHAAALAATGSGIYLITKPDGSVWGWGKDHDGILGLNPGARTEELVRVGGLEGITDIQAGTDHVLALDRKGQVYTWGSNMTGQLGRLPVWFRDWTEIGRLDDVEQAAVSGLDRPYLVRSDGTVWGWDDGLHLHEVAVAGLSNVRSVTGIFGVPVTLHREGKVRFWSRSFGDCRELKVPFAVKAIAGGEEELLLHGEDGRFAAVKLKADTVDTGDGRYTIQSYSPTKAEYIAVEGEWTKQVKAVYSNPYTYMALTEDGRIYYTDRKEDGRRSYKPVEGVEGIRALAPEFFVRYTAEPAQVWAMDAAGRVRELVVKPVLSVGEVQGVQMELVASTAAEEGVAAISGKLRLTRDQRLIFDDREWSRIVMDLPEPVRLAASSYRYAIEGPGSHYHLLVTESGKLVLIGANPWGRQSAVPDRVVVPGGE